MRFTYSKVRLKDADKKGAYLCATTALTDVDAIMTTEVAAISTTIAAAAATTTAATLILDADAVLSHLHRLQESISVS